MTVNEPNPQPADSLRASSTPARPCEPASLPVPLGALEALDLAVFTLDRRARIDYWNDAAETLYGRAGDEVRGRPLDELLGDANAATEGEMVPSRRTVCTGDVAVPAADGTTKTVSFVSWPRWDGDGDPGAVVVSTERVRSIDDRHDLTSPVWVSEAANRVRSTPDRPVEDERRGRRQEHATMIASLLTELEGHASVHRQLQVLAEALVPGLGDTAVVDVPGVDQPISASTRGDRASSILRAARSELVQRTLGNGGETTADRTLSGTVVVDAVPGGHPGGVFQLAVAPLRVDPDITGNLIVARNGRPYLPDELTLLEEIVDRSALVVSRTRVLEREHEISTRLQEALLPDRVLWHPSVVIDVGYSAAGELMEVGGDWYDTFAWPTGELAVLVGDVAGHSIESAVTMGRVRAAMEPHVARADPTAAGVIAALRQSIRPATDFLTALCLVVDPATGSLSYSSAGHCPPIVMPRHGRARRIDGAVSPPVSALEVWSEHDELLSLAPGDLVVAYTDGLVERRGEDLDVGLARLESAVEAVADEPPSVVVDRLIDIMVPSSETDDVVVVAFRYAPELARFERTSSLVDAPHQLADLDQWLAARDVGPDEADAILSVSNEAVSALTGVGSEVVVESEWVRFEVSIHVDHVIVRIVHDGSVNMRPGLLAHDRGGADSRSVFDDGAVRPDVVDLTFVIEHTVRPDGSDG